MKIKQKVFSAFGGLFILLAGACHADNLPPTPPPYHSGTPATSVETVLSETNVPVSAIHVNFGSFGGKETDIVNGPTYDPDDTRIFVNGIQVKSANSPNAPAVGLEFEIEETISNRASSSSSVSARYVDPSDIPALQNFVGTMDSIAKSLPKAGQLAEVTYQTPGGTIFYYKQNGTHTPDFEIANGSTDYYTFQFNKLVDLDKFVSDLAAAAKWVVQQQSTPST